MALYLYKISHRQVPSQGTITSAVVVSNSWFNARKIHPAQFREDGEKNPFSWDDERWASTPELVETTPLGKLDSSAFQTYEAGDIVLVSFSSE